MRKTKKTYNQALLLKAALRASDEAGKVLCHYFEKEIHAREKNGAGLVTIADTTAEKKIMEILRKAAPEFHYLAEESRPSKQAFIQAQKKNTPFWIIDPLDGTTNFVHRFPMFCVSIGAFWNGKIQLGVIHHPVLNETYYAVRGKGAFLITATGKKKKLRVSKTKQLSHSLLTTGFFTYQKDFEIRKQIAAFATLTTETRGVRRPGSAALDLAYTARGVFDGYWEINLSPWDIAAGAVIVEEAGGSVTGLEGRPLDLLSGNILASNSWLHGKLKISLRRSAKMRV